MLPIFNVFRRTDWMLVALFLCIPYLTSCSSTAVQGRPVKEMVMARNPLIFGEAPTRKERQAVAEMSRVKENKTFKMVSGVAEYRIGPRDVLTIDSRVGENVKSIDVPVDSRGDISYSFLDDVHVSGLTPSELEALLKKKLSAYIRHPRIDVRVKKFRSKSALITGEFGILRATNVSQTISGTIYLKGETSLMDVIAEAGGYTVNADIKDVRLIRHGRTYSINLYNIIEKGDQSQNVIIDAGDIIDIPESPIGQRVYVLGAVQFQGVYPLRNAPDLLSAIALAGSFTNQAKAQQTLIIRGYDAPGAKPLVMMADLDALLKKADVSQNIPLQDGDLIYVPRTWIANIAAWIDQAQPMLNLIRWPGDTYRGYRKSSLININR